jgi:GT2 family glycosyltransferase
MSEVPPNAPDFRGHIDFLGFHAGAGGLVFGGWVSHALAAQIPLGDIVMTFSDAQVTAAVHATFYHREALGDLGTGMVLFVLSSERPAGTFVSVSTAPGSAAAGHLVTPTPNTCDLPESELPLWVGPLLNAAAPRLPDPVMLALGARTGPAGGAIDVIGFSGPGRCWLASGWLAGGIPETPWSVVWHFQNGLSSDAGVIAWHERGDLAESGIGFVALLPDTAGTTGPPSELAFVMPAGTTSLCPTPATRALRDEALRASIAGSAEQAVPEAARAVLAARLSWQPFHGTDTLGALTDRVLLEVDQTILCPPDGLVLMGWTLSPPGAVREIRICSDRHRAVFDLARCVRIPRPDVTHSVGENFGFDEPRCGFIALAAPGHAAKPQVWLEVETTRGELGYKPLPAPVLHGMAAMRSLLADCDVQFADVAPAFDLVLGPAIESLNAARLLTPPSADPVQYGTPPAAPEVCVVVPLHGRLDFMEAQAALFARDAGARRCEFIYVLDDPAKRRDAENLVASIHARFGLPMTLIVLGRAVGIAPASNIGLASARAPHVCFLNADVFPLSDRWLNILAARLDADPGLGLLGPLLLHDDGTVRHQGIEFRRQPRYADWFFGHHKRLALRPPRDGGVHRSIAITGACVMLRTAVARQLDGFDEHYVTGDFEDTDLCLRAGELGLASAVDFDVRLCHLGRNAQRSTAERWQMNLTLYDAWRHDRRWRSSISTSLETPPGAAEGIG